MPEKVKGPIRLGSTRLAEDCQGFKALSMPETKSPRWLEAQKHRPDSTLLRLICAGKAFSVRCVSRRRGISPCVWNQFQLKSSFFLVARFLGQTGVICSEKGILSGLHHGHYLSWLVLYLNIAPYMWNPIHVWLWKLAATLNEVVGYKFHWIYDSSKKAGLSFLYPKEKDTPPTTTFVALHGLG